MSETSAGSGGLPPQNSPPPQPVRSPPTTSSPASTFPTYAPSSGKAGTSSASYYAPPNTSYLSTRNAAANSSATQSSPTSSPSASSTTAAAPASFSSPHPFASSTVVVTPSPSTASHTPHRAPQSSTNAIVVSPRQRGNPVLAHIRNCPWEFAPSPADSSASSHSPPPFLADYLLGPTTCALYLSLRYHLLHPLYLLSRMQPLRSHYTVRLLLLQMDVDDSEPPLSEVTTACFTNGWTLLLGWTVDEIGRWLELFKVFESKGKESLEGGGVGGEAVADEERVRDTLAVVRGVNKTDTGVLMSTFGSLTALARASEAELLACVGMGAKKVKRLRMAFNQPFISSQAVRTVMGTTPVKPASEGDEAKAAAGGERKEAGAAGKRSAEEADKEKAQPAASSSQSFFTPSKKQRSGAIVRLD